MRQGFLFRLQPFHLEVPVRKALTLIFPLILTLGLLLGACNANHSITLADGLGREVILEEPAQRIVSLAPSNTEILFAIGAGAQVVGRDEFSNYPAEALDLPSVGGSWGEYNQEAILALEPDLVLASELNPPELIQQLAELGLTVYQLPNPSDLEGLYTNLETVGRLTAHEAEAATLADNLKDRAAAVLAAVATVETVPVVFYELDASDPQAPWTAGPGTFIDTLLSLAGGRNAAAGLEGAWVQLSLEALLGMDPDIILLGDSNYGITPQSVAARPGWESLKAVQNNQVFEFNDDLVSRPSPRLVDGLEALARLLHPEAFE
jgi:iron complex transport system substrate-binding protein